MDVKLKDITCEQQNIRLLNVRPQMVEDSKLAQKIPFLKYSNLPLLLICAISDYQPVILGCNSCLHFGAKHAKQMLWQKMLVKYKTGFELHVSCDQGVKLTCFILTRVR